MESFSERFARTFLERIKVRGGSAIYAMLALFLCAITLPEKSTIQHIIGFYLLLLVLPPIGCLHVAFYLPKTRKFFTNAIQYNGFWKNVGLACMAQIIGWCVIILIWSLFNRF